jgi:hypothetical protein
VLVLVGKVIVDNDIDGTIVGAFEDGCIEVLWWFDDDDEDDGIVNDDEPPFCAMANNKLLISRLFGETMDARRLCCVGLPSCPLPNDSLPCGVDAFDIRSGVCVSSRISIAPAGLLLPIGTLLALLSVRNRKPGPGVTLPAPPLAALSVRKRNGANRAIGDGVLIGTPVGVAPPRNKADKERSRSR